MEFLEAVVLGIVQGITEFLPISSDGHLILVPSLLGWKRFGLGFDVVLHAGTLLATVLYFREDLWRIATAMVSKSERRARERRLGWLLVGTVLPSVAVVLALEPFVEGVESRPVSEQIAISALGLLATTVVLGASELVSSWQRRRRLEDEDASRISWPVALGIGFAQGFAALPGLSRSGTTIATGQALGLSRGEAARFSFLMSVPIVAAALAKKLLDVLTGEGALPAIPVTLLGLVVTTAVGYAVIWVLLPFVRKHSLWWFAAYTGIAGILLVATYAL